MPGEYELGDLSGVLGGDLYNNLFGSMGFEGQGDGFGGYGEKASPWMEQVGWNEGSNPLWGFTPTQNAMDSFDNYSFNWQPQGGQAGLLTAFDPSGQQYGQYQQKDDDTFTKLMGMVAPMVATGGFGGALSGMFGGGFLGSAAGQGLASGSISAAQGGDFGKGFLGGAISGGLQGLSAGAPAVMGNNPSAYVPATPGTSIAGSMGITSPLASGMINRGSGSFLGALASGGSGSDALKSGLTGAAMSGINSVGKSVMTNYLDSFNSWLGGGQQQGTEADYSTGSTSYGSNYMAPGQEAMRSAGLFPEMSNVPPSSSNFQTLDTIGLPSYDSNPFANASYAMGGYKPNGVSALEQAGLRNEMSYALPGSEGDYDGSFLNNILSDNGAVPDKSTQSVGQSSFSLPSILGNAGSRVGNFALNNAGDLASMLYGFYNNRKQQKALQGQMNQVNQATSQLQNMFGQNSPYAQQLRSKLNAQAAASGRRSNTAGRETQFQAMLADKAASTLPQIANMQNSMLQTQQARGSLQNSLGSNALSMLNKMGVFNGLANMFGNKNPYANYSMANNTSDYNSLGMEGHY